MMARVSTDARKIDWLLTHAVENILPSREELKRLLASGKRIRVYNGIDPTGPTLHLGHMITLKKLAELQELGHEVILLIGDFTAMIGDPTDKSATRKKLTREQVMENCRLYQKQAARVLKFDGPNAAQLKFNSAWLAKMKFEDVIELASHFTVQRMLERDMFEKRYRGVIKCPKCLRDFVSPVAMRFVGPTPSHEEEGTGNFWAHPAIQELFCPNCQQPLKPYFERDPVSFIAKYITKPKPIYLHEFLYPLMQGYDSVAMDVDLEVGGNDQTFNMLAGRDLQRIVNKKEKFVLATKLLADPTGIKMGKSEGNMIALTDAPEDMYGKVMSWPDGMIVTGFEICTDATPDEVKKISQAMKKGENPMTFKRELAHRIVMWLVGSSAADKAAEHFTKVHREHERPEDIPTVRVGAHGHAPIPLIDALVAGKLVASKSEARRQIEQGGIKVDDRQVTDVKATLKIGKEGVVIQKGKRHFVRLVP
jgi:tyrosyl-tRNA synthetase